MEHTKYICRNCDGLPCKIEVPSWAARPITCIYYSKASVYYKSDWKISSESFPKDTYGEVVHEFTHKERLLFWRNMAEEGLDVRERCELLGKYWNGRNGEGRT